MEEFCNANSAKLNNSPNIHASDRERARSDRKDDDDLRDPN